MIHDTQLDYYAILKRCVDDTIHPGYTRYTNDEVAIFVGNLNLYLKVDQKGNIYYKLPMSKPDEQTWIQWNKLSELTSKVNGGFESYLRWIYEKYADALMVGIDNRVWSMDLFYKTREVDGKQLQNICYAYLSNQVKDIDKSKLTILPITYYNDPGFSKVNCIDSNKAYATLTEPTKRYLIETDRLLSAIDALINKLTDNRPTIDDEVKLYELLLADITDYYLAFNCIKRLNYRLKFIEG